MKLLTLKSIIIAAVLSMSVAVLAADYSNYSLQELAQMRGTLMNKSVEERNAFRDAWREKMRSATPQERAQYARGNRYGQGNTNGNGTCDGTGHGRGHGHGRR